MPRRNDGPEMGPLIKITDDGAELLRWAIVNSVVDDVKDAIKKQKRLIKTRDEIRRRRNFYMSKEPIERINMQIEGNKHTILSLIRFFRSPWFRMLSMVDGERIYQFFLEQIPV